MTDDTIATVRLAGSEIDRAQRQALIMADGGAQNLAWVALLSMHVGALAESLAVGDTTSAVLAIRKMQADLEACKQEIAA